MNGAVRQHESAASMVNPMTLSPIVRTPLTYLPVSQQIYQAVRQDIIACQLLPGAKLSEKELSERFGISRQPVREALIKLSQDGLIQVLPQRGTFVRRISAKRVADGRFIREAIELAVVEKAAGGLAEPVLEALERNLQAQEEEVRKQNRERFLVFDDAFHDALAQAIDCASAWQMLQHIKANMDRVRYLSLANESPLSVLLMQHQAIFQAIKAQDAQAARLAVQLHLKELNLTFASIATRNSDWFEP